MFDLSSALGHLLRYFSVIYPLFIRYFSDILGDIFVLVVLIYPLAASASLSASLASSVCFDVFIGNECRALMVPVFAPFLVGFLA